MEQITKSLEETQALASEWVVGLAPRSSSASVVGLSGDLGSGKTSFVQGVAKALGVAEHVTSPTFILERIYPTSHLVPLELRGASKLSSSTAKWMHLIHIDAYRLDSPNELKHLGLAELVSNPGNLILIEWPERVAEGLPADMLTLNFTFIDENTRKISLVTTPHHLNLEAKRPNLPRHKASH
ncbi:MAG TPA: tRNA (adenosine(37)-N6)-threonylcarbamoyltransferase complex ATPase subunit type 1 TsaE [Candidatus Paceibacterota bacterium]